ncbi:MAG: hypothetical protein JO090_06700 [Rhizobacter sp.]|nr:hypothetical protein [Rhizobacter sp.]
MAPALGAVPRFRSELGLFLGFAGSMSGRYVDGAFIHGQTQHGFIGDVDLSVRLALGLEGVLGDADDGLVFVSLGIRRDSPSANKLANGDRVNEPGSLGSAIPNRMGCRRGSGCRSTSFPAICCSSRRSTSHRPPPTRIWRRPRATAA